MRPSSSVVLDASAIVQALTSPEASVSLRAAIAGATPIAPEVVDVEVLAGLRRTVARGAMTDEDAREAIQDHLDFPLERVPHGPFLHGAWELRHNLTAADAVYVAVTRAFEGRLVTADRRLAAAPGLGVAVTVLPS